MYALGGTGNATTTANAVRWELRAGSTKRVYLRELHVMLGAGTASIIALNRALAIGLTPTSPVSLLVQDPADLPATSVAQIATAWGTAPTVTAAEQLRRANIAASIGAGIIWTFGPRELVIPVSGSLILWNVGAASAVVDYAAVIEE